MSNFRLILSTAQEQVQRRKRQAHGLSAMERVLYRNRLPWQFATLARMRMGRLMGRLSPTWATPDTAGLEQIALRLCRKLARQLNFDLQSKTVGVSDAEARRILELPAAWAPVSIATRPVRRAA